MSLGWGTYVMILAWLRMRERSRRAVVAPWAGGLPALTLSTLAEPLRFGTFEVGSLLSAAVLGVFLVGLLLPIRALRADPEGQPSSDERSQRLVG